MADNNLVYALDRNIFATGSLGIGTVTNENTIRFVITNAGVTNAILVRARVNNQLTWTNLVTLTGNVNQTIDVFTYDQVEVIVQVYDSLSDRVIIVAGSFNSEGTSFITDSGNISETSTVTFTSSDNSVTITGNDVTNTIDFIVVGGGSVDSVNGQTGVVVLTASDVGADPAGTAQTLVGDKYVRTTRFEIIGSGTSGTVTLPADSTVVLDDFGGTVDAVVAQSTGGKPTMQSAKTAGGEIVSTSFDSSGNWVFTGTPSAYPVAILYRVRQKLSDFDSTSADIFGNSNVEQVTAEDIGDGSVSNTEFQFLDGVTSNIQTQINATAATIFHPREGYRTIDHFDTILAAGSTGWITVANSGTITGSAQFEDRASTLRFRTSTSSIAAPTLTRMSTTYSVSFGFGIAYLFEVAFYMPNLSTAAEEYVTRYGFINQITNTTPTDGVWIEYNRAVSGNFWLLKTCANSVTTTTVTTVPVVAATWLELKMIINADGTLASFWLDSVLLGTITTNIPSGTARLCGPTLQPVMKTVGTTERINYVDWCIVGAGAGAY